MPLQDHQLLKSGLAGVKRGNRPIMSTMADEKTGHNLDPEVEKSLPAPLADAIKNGNVPDKVLKHSHDADEALKAFASHEGTVIEIDEATNKRLLRRIDWNLMPVWTV